MTVSAFNWVTKEIGYAKAARTQKPDGALALFWNISPRQAGQLAKDLNRIYRAVALVIFGRKHRPYKEKIQERLNDITASGCFGPVTARCFPLSRIYRTKDYRGLLNTQSDRLRMPEYTRRRIFEGFTVVIDAYDGSIKHNHLSDFHLPRKLI